METTIVETIEIYNEYIAKLPNGCLITANLLRDDQINVAMDNIANFAEGMQWLLHMTALLQQYEIHTRINPEQINEFLNEINEALTNEDYYLVADIFEYELAEFMKKLVPLKVDQ